MANDIDKTSPHYKGDFGSIYEVNKKFPTGGVAGDFVVIEGWAHYWNADRATWCVNAERDSYWDELITNIIEKFKLVRGATYMGVASLDTVPAKVIGAKSYYFATVAGTYKNFGDLVVPQGINVLYSENGSSWVNTTLLEVAQELGVSTKKVVSQKALNDALNLKANQSSVNEALEKKFDKESIAQESGEAEDKVMSQKVVSTKLRNLSSSLLANTPCLYTDNAELNKILKYCHVSKKESVGDFSFSLYSSGILRINLQNNTPIQIGINKCYNNNTLYYNDGNILILMVFDWNKITSNIYNVKFTENAFCKLDAIGDKTIAEINSHFKFISNTANISYIDCLELASSVEEVYIDGGMPYYGIQIWNGQGENYIVRLYGGNTAEDATIIAAKNIDSDTNGYIDVSPLHIILDLKKLSKQYYSTIQAKNYSLSDNPKIAKILSDKQLKVNMENVNKKIDEITEQHPTYSVSYIDVYATSSDVPKGISASYIGVKAIQTAIDSITDASKDKRYVVRLHGTFIATAPSDWNGPMPESMGEYAIFYLQNTDYISVKGDGMDKTFLKGNLSDNLGESFNYHLYNTITQNGNHSKISDMTLYNKNGRYVIHTDRSSLDKLNNAEQEFENIHVICPKNTGDAAKEWASKGSYLCGWSSGMKVYFHDSTIESEVSGFGGHDNESYNMPFNVTFENVKFIPLRKSVLFAGLSCLSAGVNNKFKFKNVYGIGLINLPKYTGNNRTSQVDDRSIEFEGDFTNDSRIGLVLADITPNQLRIDVIDTTTPHEIWFDAKCSAFDRVINDTNPSPIEKYGIFHGKGHIYKYGDIGFSAWCMGLKPVAEGMKDSATTKLSARLGDCSSSPLILGLYVDSVQMSISLDADYSSMSNSDVLADMNGKLSKLNIPCKASLYSYGMEKYMETNNVVSMVNYDENPITQGHIVKRKDNGFALCTSTKDVFGVLLDDVKSGGIARVLTKGVIERYSQRFWIRPHGMNGSTERFGCSLIGELVEDANGCFAAFGEHAIIFPI